MERYIVFMDWKNQYYQNDYTVQGNLQIQCRTGTKNIKTCMETQKILKSQSNLEKEKWN